MMNVAFISHGGGPLPILGDANHQEMNDTLKTIVGDIPKPDVIIVISAHWEEDVIAITSSPSPELIYDYNGFPPKSYEITYPAPGSPQVAKELQRLISAKSIAVTLDEDRGFDHGVFIPLKMMYPNADMPVVQISLNRNLDPELHIALGGAIGALTYENVLVLGSGFSFHNLQEFRHSSAIKDLNNEAFEHWLTDTMTNKDLSEEDREERLVNWSSAPSARYCHPREEHLLPIHVCYGIAGRTADTMYSATIMKKLSSMYLWRGV